MWRSAEPILRIRDPHKDEKMAVIHKAPDEFSTKQPVFYEDEVSININPKIVADWKQQQKFGAVHQSAEAAQSDVPTGKTITLIVDN